MEPFFIRCETCRARLRVRDERFLGQVQSCPKCGSMVQIIAPAGWLAASDASAAPQESVPAATAEATAAGSFASASLLRNPIALWSAGGAAVLIVGGLVGMLAVGGEDEVALAPTMPPAVEVAEVAPQIEDAELVEEKVTDATQHAEESPEAASEATNSAPASAPLAASTAFLPLEPVVENDANALDSPELQVADETEAAAQTRTLTLEVVKPSPGANSVATTTPEPSADYPPALEIDAEASVEAVPPIAAERPNRRTNVDDQLSVPIDTIELPAMPIGEFVNMISDMSAVPIRLDPKVLGDVGLSTRTKVVVHGGDITLGALLARVLNEHQLTCVERDGELIVVKAER